MSGVTSVLEVAIRRLLGHARPEVAEPPVVTPAFRHHAAHVRVSLAALDLVADTAGVERLVAGLRDMPGIAHVSVGPAFLYLRLGPALLNEFVVADVVAAGGSYGASAQGAGRRVIVTYSDPNMNKPLHVGHLRNLALGSATAELLAFRGYDVDRQAVHSDWGVHIAQAVVAYLRWGEGRTPADEGLRPDVFVGRYYARFHEENGREDDGSVDDADATPLEAEAAALVRALDAGTASAEVVAAMRQVTDWCEVGVAATYARLGIGFDHVFRERDGIARARAMLDAAVADGRCRVRADGSVFVDLEADGLADLTLVRRNGTLVVYSQWLGNDIVRYADPPERIVQLAGYEWKPGQLQYLHAARRMGMPWVESWRHVHYGMVRLATGGKMSSRAGAVVGAEELLDEVAARLVAAWDAPAGVAAAAICEQLSVALTKYALLRTPRTRDIAFDLDELVSAGAARLAKLVRVLAWLDSVADRDDGQRPWPVPDNVDVADLLAEVNAFGGIVASAAADYEPAVVLRYAEQLGADAGRLLRRWLVVPPVARAVATTLRIALRLTGITLPDDLSVLPPPFTRAGATESRHKALATVAE